MEGFLKICTTIAIPGGMANVESTTELNTVHICL